MNNAHHNIADAILVLLSDERHRTTEEVHDFVERNDFSDHKRSTLASLRATQFNLVSEQAPYRLRRTESRPCRWHLQTTQTAH